MSIDGINTEFCRVSIKGITPLLLDNGECANPFHPIAQKKKELNSKMKKTLSDYREICDLDWDGSIYWNDELGAYIPVENIYKALHSAMKKHKLGPKICGIFLDQPIGYPIIAKNAKNKEALKQNPENRLEKMAKVNNAKVLKTRVIFPEWAINITFDYEPDVLNRNDIKTIFLAMSRFVGIGVWTPASKIPGRYGKFLIDGDIQFGEESKKTRKAA
jgi:hypothetical protein